MDRIILRIQTKSRKFMNFPDWADCPKAEAGERRRKRLTFLLKKAALRFDERARVSRLAEVCGLDASTLHQSVRRLKITPATRQKLSEILTEEELSAIDAEMSAPNE